MIEGPCRVVDTILAAVNKKSIITFVESGNFSLNVTDTTSSLRLESYPTHTNKRLVMSSPRVGLTLRRSDDLSDAFIKAQKQKKSVADFVGIDFKADVLIKLCAASM